MKRKRGRPSAISLAAALMGAKGGKIGGKRRLETMTAEERIEAARHAGTEGGHARAAALSPARRRAIGKLAAAARWGKEPRA
ncbi:MAG: hypothetical protein JNL62_21940 [Bryobacterales bacterium]|nr:hypothetical protein [Bryobacterales bacterium]